MKKRGAIEVQLNWIFVLIIGVIIFSFFIVIANKQKEASENRVSIIVKKNIETFIRASENSANSFNRIEIPESELKFTCDSRGISNFEVGGRGLKESLTYDVVFSPEELGGNTLYFWTLEFQKPFRITSYLYASNDQVKYIFIQDPDGFVDGLYGFMPEQFDKALVKSSSVSALAPKNYDYYVFIMKSKESEDITLNLDAFGFNDRISIISIIQAKDAQGIPQEYGNIRFYDDKLVKYKAMIPYLGNESIFGAIFSASPANYRCNMQKSIRKLNLLAQIYHARAQKLSDMHNGANDPCRYLYEYPLQNLNKLKANSNPDFTDSTIRSIAEAGDSLAKNNEALFLKPQCQSIY